MTEQDKKRILGKVKHIKDCLDIEDITIEDASHVINLYGELVLDQGQILTNLVNENSNLQIQVAELQNKVAIQKSQIR